MVRVFNMDGSPDDEAEVLTPAFRAATLKGLERSFTSSVEKKQALQDFQRAAARLATHEIAFSRRAKPQDAGLLHYLRPAPHFAALRAFNMAQEVLTDMDSTIGGEIARRTAEELARNSLATPAAAKPRRPSGQTLQ